MESTVVNFVGIVVLLIGLFYNRPLPPLSHMIIAAILSDLSRALVRSMLQADSVG